MDITSTEQATKARGTLPPSHPQVPDLALEMDNAYNRVPRLDARLAELEERIAVQEAEPIRPDQFDSLVDSTRLELLATPDLDNIVSDTLCKYSATDEFAQIVALSLVFKKMDHAAFQDLVQTATTTAARETTSHLTFSAHVQLIAHDVFNSKVRDGIDTWINTAVANSVNELSLVPLVQRSTNNKLESLLSADSKLAVFYR